MITCPYVLNMRLGEPAKCKKELYHTGLHCFVGAEESTNGRWETTGAALKNDAGKPRMELLDPAWLEEVAKVMGQGAEDYGVNNWRKGLAWTRIIGALLRHTFAFARGEDRCPKSGMLHTAHASANLMMLTSYQLTKTGTDDRYKKEA